MCGRFSISTPVSELMKRFNIKTSTVIIKPNYNAAPSQNLPVILNESPNELSVARWGFIPVWAKQPNIGYKMINARAETILEKTTFKRAMENYRCLVLADGFFEWKKTDDGKVPYRITLSDGKPFAFAGLWSKWKDDKDIVVNSCTLITTTPNKKIKNIHDRMPVMLEQKEEKKWLDTGIGSEDAAVMLDSYPDDKIKTYEVSTLVNSPKNNSPDVILKV